MTPLKWLICATLFVGCGFGDNHASDRGSTHHACGDGVLDPAEGCDDGNTVSGDGCSETCAVEAAHPVCGNGIREVGEACDDGNPSSGDGCSAGCAVESVCGNGVREAGEDCDDGNTTSGDGCSPTCHVELQTACMLVPQGGCSGTTPACDIADDATTACRGVTAQGTSNDHCTVDTACKAGYTCVHDGTVATPWCMRFCLHDTDCAGTGSRCVDALDDSMGNPLNVDVCSNACGVYSQTGCPSGMGCLGHDATAGDFTDCAYMGNKLDGATCAGSLECLPGSACVTSGGVSTCRSYCIVGDPSTCASPMTCAGFVSPLTIGTVQFGVCL